MSVEQWGILVAWIIGLGTGWIAKGFSMLVGVVRSSGSTGLDCTINEFWPDGFYCWSETSTGANQ